MDADAGDRRGELVAPGAPQPTKSVYHDHEWVEMTDERFTARDTGEPIRWWMCHGCGFSRFKRKDVAP